ncbi:hypothetical protein DL767_007030 [Monosporascus sp. MG133]|nr:hypothetical protein DL767_007030 [Monosporascus sp. MG133]
MYNLTKAFLGALLLTLLLNALVSTTPLAAPRPTQSPMEREATMTPLPPKSLEVTGPQRRHRRNQHLKWRSRKRRGSLQRGGDGGVWNHADSAGPRGRMEVEEKGHWHGGGGGGGGYGRYMRYRHYQGHPYVVGI